MNDLVFTVVGYNTKQHRNVSHNFSCETRIQAQNKCRELYPDVDVYYVAMQPENN
jgi:hypothetical protein